MVQDHCLKANFKRNSTNLSEESSFQCSARNRRSKFFSCLVGSMESGQGSDCNSSLVR